MDLFVFIIFPDRLFGTELIYLYELTHFCSYLLLFQEVQVIIGMRDCFRLIKYLKSMMLMSIDGGCACDELSG